MSTPTLREQLMTALEADPHFGTGETVDTVMRVLGEQHGDLRDQMAGAIRKAAHWCDGRCNCTEDDGHGLFVTVLTFDTHVEQVEGTPTSIADAVMPVVRAWAAEQTQRCPSCDHRADLHQPDGCWFTVTVGTVDRDLGCSCSLPRAALDRQERTTHE